MSSDTMWCTSGLIKTPHGHEPEYGRRLPIPRYADCVCLVYFISNAVIVNKHLAFVHWPLFREICIHQLETTPLRIATAREPILSSTDTKCSSVLAEEYDGIGPTITGHKSPDMDSVIGCGIVSTSESNRLLNENYLQISTGYSLRTRCDG